MKKVAFALMVGILAFSPTFASNNPELVEEIHEKVIIDLSTIELDKYNQDYVLVHFKISNGRIDILEAHGSTIELKELIVKKLMQLDIKSNYLESGIYRYNFTFEKI